MGTASNLWHISSGEQKIPDICTTKIIDPKRCKVKSCLWSDHSPVIITIYTNIQNKENQPFLYNKIPNCDVFRTKLDDNITLKCPLKTDFDIKMEIENLTTNIQKPAYLTQKQLKKKTWCHTK